MALISKSTEEINYLNVWIEREQKGTEPLKVNKKNRQKPTH